MVCHSRPHQYTRWLSVYVADIKGLPVHHPDVFSEFSNGNFAVSKKNKLSQISTDQDLEHVYKLVKQQEELLVYPGLIVHETDGVLHLIISHGSQMKLFKCLA